MNRGQIVIGADIAATRDRRRAGRVDVELSALWRPCGSDDIPSLAVVSDLSTLGARVGGWTPYDLAVGDCIELWVEPWHEVRAQVARALAGGEYGVQFDGTTLAFRAMLASTVHSARRGRPREWVHPANLLLIAPMML